MNKHELGSLTEASMLNSIASVLSLYISETDPNVLFNGLLETLLQLTESEYGFIGEVVHQQDGVPYLQCKAITDISWDEKSHSLYQAIQSGGAIFSKLNTLYGEVLTTGKNVIANQPATDPRRGGLPPGHPALNSFMGLPFYASGELLGVVGIANRDGGFSDSLAQMLQPFVVTCGNLIVAYRNNVRHDQVAQELEQYRAQLNGNEVIALGDGYEFDAEAWTVYKDGEVVDLTNKELLLLECFLRHQGKLVKYVVIEAYVWSDVVVGDSSLRVLVMRLRKKIPSLQLKVVSGLGYIFSLKSD